MRTIHMRVTGDTVALDSSVAGVQGSGNVDKVVVSFDEGWDGYAKSACWWDGHGVQAGEPRLLTADMLVDLTRDDRTYILVAPPEALRWPGACTLVIDGYKDGALARTVRQELQVVPAPASAQGTAVTPTQAQQLQSEIEVMVAAVTQAGEAATHGPCVNAAGNWLIWDLETKTYVDSGIYAGGSPGPQGEKGEKGDKGDRGEDGVLLDLTPGLFAMALSGEGHLLVAVREDEPVPPLEIDGETGHLLYKISN